MKTLRVQLAEAKGQPKDPMTVSFVVDRGSDCATMLPKLLGSLQYLGEVGSSRGVSIEDFGDDGKPLNLGFDGDGSDKIYDLKVDGKDYKLPKDK